MRGLSAALSGRSRSDRRWKVPIRRGFAATGLSLLVLLGGIAGGDFHAPAGVAGSSDIHGLPSAVSLHATPTLESGPYRGTGLKAQSTVRPDGSTPTRRAAPGGDPLSISNLTATPLRGQD